MNTKPKCEKGTVYRLHSQAKAAAQRFYEHEGDYLIVFPCRDHFHLELKETWKRRAA